MVSTLLTIPCFNLNTRGQEGNTELALGYPEDFNKEKGDAIRMNGLSFMNCCLEDSSAKSSKEWHKMLKTDGLSHTATSQKHGDKN